MALAQHLDAGYWSNPPFIAWWTALIESTLGTELWAYRLSMGLLSMVLVFLSAEMAKILGGNSFAQIIAALAIACSPAFLRTFLFLMPVPIDILFWTLFLFLWMKYVQHYQTSYLYALGICLGFAMLNKYSIPFLVLGFLIVLPFSKQNTLFRNKEWYVSLGIAFLIFLPNLVWQMVHDFPVLTHLSELQANQLTNINPLQFLTDQLWIHLLGTLIWLPGLFYLLFSKQTATYKHLAWMVIAVIILFVVFRGKHYYTLGLYPLLFASGACWWSQVGKRYWLLLPIVVLLLNFYIALPAAIPLFPAQKMVHFFDALDKDYGLKDIRRWEDGNYYALPQDFADMIAWEELAQYVSTAYERASSPSKTVIYAENYGQAGAIHYFTKNQQLPEPLSLADSYRLWLPKTMDANALIYVNDELGEDVDALFEDIRLIGSVQHSLAREQGTRIYLCQQPVRSLKDFWEERVKMVRGH